MKLSTAKMARLNFIKKVVEKERRHLISTAKRLFDQPFTLDRVRSLETDELLSERVEAFSSRFARLQDTVGDKWLPLLLEAVDERCLTQSDNYDVAERLGWIPSVDEWYAIRAIRNQMVHEYIEDQQILMSAINKSYDYCSTIEKIIEQMNREMMVRGLILDEGEDK
jgi:hypothetical protein